MSTTGPQVLDHEIAKSLETLIGTLIKNGGKQLDSKTMKELKSTCRTNENYVEHVFHLLMTEMRRDHAEVRYISLLIIDELFNRSHKFRSLLLAEFQEFLELTAETDPDYPLPAPKAAAKDLKEKTLECVSDWYKKFHEGYKLLVIGYNFLKDSKMVDFANMETRTVVQRQLAEEHERRKEAALKEAIIRTTNEMNELAPEMNCLFLQMENCLKILIPQSEDIFDPSDFEGKQQKSNPSKVPEDGSLRQHGFHNRADCNIQLDINTSSEIVIESSADTDTILSQLRELHKEVEQSCIPAITKWIQVYTKGSCTTEMKKVIDLKQRIDSTLKKCKALRIKAKTENHDKDNDDDDDEFEEVPDKDGLELVIPQNKRHEYGLEAATSTLQCAPTTPRLWKVKSESKEEVKDPTTLAANLQAITRKIDFSAGPEQSYDQPSTSKGITSSSKTSRKSGLLSKAPKLAYDVDLYHWEDEKLEAPTIVKFDSLHRFWQPNENELSERQAEEGVAALRRRYIDFSGKFTPVTHICRAPLTNGKLCPRQDRLKCPFHGKVIPRDEMGNPRQQQPEEPQPSTSTEELVPDWQDPQLLKDIEAATGVDLKMPVKRRKGGKGNKGTKKTNKDCKLTNIKVIKNTTRKRLERKVLNKNSVKRVAATLDRLDRKKFSDKFGHQWNYSFNT